jgi:oligoendopeptidase F
MCQKLGGLMLMLTLSAAFFQAETVMSQSRERSLVPVQDTWNLGDLYPTDAAWRQAKENLVGRFDQVLQFKGKAASSASTLLACLDFNSNLSKEFGRLRSYASMKSDEDVRMAANLAMTQEVSQIGTDYSSKASFIEPELVRMDKATIEKYIAEEPKLAPYKMYLFDLQRRKAHMLSEKEEKIMAESRLMADGPYTINSVFSNAELPYPQATLTDGTAIKLDQAGYTRYRALPKREDRKIVFETFWPAIAKFKQTFGAQLYANVKTDMFNARTRGYASCLESALDPGNIPVEVYRALVRNVNANLGSFHRYLALRKRMLGVDTLRYFDLYSPVVKGVDLQYDYAQSNKLILEALKPLGKPYTEVVKKAMAERWVDVYPTTGKRSGAYSNGSAYDVHPYILLNYNGLFDDVSTLAHELGHTMHSYFSNKAQPFPTSDYSIFVAEVASTFNEALLIDKMLKDIKDDDVRLSLLMEYLDNIKGTVFRQTQFAEYELAIHEKAEKGEPLTGDVLTQVYGDIVRRYYGHDKGVCRIDDYIDVEWAYIPHFYYNFYVYQYSTSFTASTALSEKVLAGEKGAVEKYLQFLSDGGSDYPIEILKKAGVDMTSAEPFQKTMQAMNRTMDEIDKILKKKGM